MPTEFVSVHENDKFDWELEQSNAELPQFIPVIVDQLTDIESRDDEILIENSQNQRLHNTREEFGNSMETDFKDGGNNNNNNVRSKSRDPVPQFYLTDEENRIDAENTEITSKELIENWKEPEKLINLFRSLQDTYVSIRDKDPNSVKISQIKKSLGVILGWPNILDNNRLEYFRSELKSIATYQDLIQFLYDCLINFNAVFAHEIKRTN